MNVNFALLLLIIKFEETAHFITCTKCNHDNRKVCPVG